MWLHLDSETGEYSTVAELDFVLPCWEKSQGLTCCPHSSPPFFGKIRSMKTGGASWEARAHYRVFRTRMFSRASNYRVAALCGVFSTMSCFMQVVTGVKESVMPRLNKWK